MPLLRDLDLVLPPLLDGVLDLLLGDLVAVVLLGDLVTAACLAWVLDLDLLLCCDLDLVLLPLLD